MKRILFLILSLALFGAVAWISADIARMVHSRKETARRIAQLPDLEFGSISGASVLLSQPARGGTVLTYFHTTCPYCKDQLQNHLADSRPFGDARVVWISNEDEDVLRRFAESAGIARHDRIEIGHDKDGAAARYFGIRRVPATFVYDADGRLSRHFTGLVRAESVAAALRDVSAGRKHVPVE